MTVAGRSPKAVRGLPVAACPGPGRERRPARAGRSRSFGDADHARIETIIRLTHRRWSIPILSELQRDVDVGGGGGAKFVTLANRLGLGRESLRDTLEHLIEHDFIMRNPGVGHPMRPEYLLAEAGHDIGPACAGLHRKLNAFGASAVGLNKWSLPVIYALGRGVMRFSRLRESLPSVTSRALTLALKDLLAAGLGARVVLDAYPPSTAYALTAEGRAIFASLKRLKPG